MRRLLFLPFLIVLGCSHSGDPCVTNNDCFAGEVCNDGFCGEPFVTVETDSGNTTTDRDIGGTTSDTGTSTDMSSTGDATTAADMGTADTDMGTTDPDMPLGACIVDPFDICMDNEDPDNNSFPGVAFAPMTRGCQSSGFVPLDETISGRQCALDPEDQYYITVVECDADEPGMVIEATLDIKDDCPADLIFFDVEQIGTSCANPNPDSEKQLRCETLATGERKISVIWPGSSVPSVGVIRFSIQTPDHQDVQFDYDLHIVIREP